MSTKLSAVGDSDRGRVATDNSSHPFCGGDLSNLAQSWVWRFSRSSNLDRFVLLYLAYRYNEDKQRAWPSIKTVAEGCGISTSSVKRSLENLQRLGELKVTSRQSDDGDFSSNSYELPATQLWIEEVIRNGRVYREGGRFPENLPRLSENLGVGSSGATNSLESNSTKESEESPLPLCKEERRAIPKPVREPKVRKGFQKTLPQKREPARKPPAAWNEFAVLFKRITDYIPVSYPEVWDAFDRLQEEIGDEEIKRRLPIWAEERGRRLSDWAAKDFLTEEWKLVGKEAGDIQSIVNEE